MFALKPLLNVWTVLGFLAGLVWFDTLIRKIKFGAWYEKLFWVILFGPAWMVIIPLTLITMWGL